MTRRELLATSAAALAVTSLATAQTAPGPFTLPPLGYAYDALEPHIDAQTMQIHHDKHHKAYVDNLNKAVAAYPALQTMTPDALQSSLASVPDAVKTAVRNQGGGHANHSLFWQTLGKGGDKPKGELAAAIDKSFGNFAGLQEKLSAVSVGQFGSGWGWVVIDGGSLKVVGLPNQDSPLASGMKPLFGIDVWEHAYYLKYQNRRADYVKAIWNVFNWDFISGRYVELTKA